MRDINLKKPKTSGPQINSHGWFQTQLTSMNIEYIYIYTLGVLYLLFFRLKLNNLVIGEFQKNIGLLLKNLVIPKSLIFSHFIQYLKEIFMGLIDSHMKHYKNN